MTPNANPLDGNGVTVLCPVCSAPILPASSHTAVEPVAELVAALEREAAVPGITYGGIVFSSHRSELFGKAASALIELRARVEAAEALADAMREERDAARETNRRLNRRLQEIDHAEREVARQEGLHRTRRALRDWKMFAGRLLGKPDDEKAAIAIETLTAAEARATAAESELASLKAKQGEARNG